MIINALSGDGSGVQASEERCGSNKEEVLQLRSYWVFPMYLCDKPTIGMMKVYLDLSGADNNPSRTQPSLDEIVAECVENLRGWSPRHDDPVVQKWFKHFIRRACEEAQELAWESPLNDRIRTLEATIADLRRQLAAVRGSA